MAATEGNFNLDKKSFLFSVSRWNRDSTGIVCLLCSIVYGEEGRNLMGVGHYMISKDIYLKLDEGGRRIIRKEYYMVIGKRRKGRIGHII